MNVEYFGAAPSREERAIAPDAYQLGLLVEAQAPEALRSLARFLGVSVTAAMAIQDAGRLGQAIETRHAEVAAERRSRCTCGCQDSGLPGADALACEAYMRRRLIPAR